jgi:MFS family permease
MSYNLDEDDSYIALLKDEKTEGADDEKSTNLINVGNAIDYKNIIPIVILYFLALFALTPICYQVIVQQVCRDISDGSDCDSSTVSSQASLIVIYTSCAIYIPSILTTGIYSSISNKLGRKIVMLIPLIGLILYSLVFAYIAHFNPKHYMYYIICASFIMGLSGSYTTFIMSVFAYVADCSIEVERHLRKKPFSVTESCIYLGKVRYLVLYYLIT